MAVLGVDIGGSGSRALLRADATHAASGDPVRIVDGGLSVSGALDSLAAQLPDIEEELEAVAVGMASMVAFGDPAALFEQVRRRWRCRRLLLASDAVTALVSVWGVEGGAVVAAGTGVVGLATDFADRWVRVDGWGHHLGDAGGGAWIGARGLQAALRAADGRAGGSTLLLEKAEAAFGSASGFSAMVSRAPSPARALAGFVPAVAAAASEGDGVAAGILSSAADELAATAAAAAAGARPPRVALVGGLTAIHPLVSRFEVSLKRLVPGVQITAGGTAPVQGALALAEAAAGGGAIRAHPPYLHLDSPRGATTAPDQIYEQGKQGKS